MSYKTTDGLMRHLRENGIQIHGSKQKRQLINTGYYHGYKGYRFFGNSTRRLPFVSNDEIYATIQYDSKLKALLYEKMMYIETAVKNIALESILIHTNSESIQDMFDRVISGYNNAPSTASNSTRQELQINKLNLQNLIQKNLANAYRKENPRITHFYNNVGYGSVPLWALFEILHMGDLGFLLSCLTWDVRNDISIRLGLNLACDTNRELIYKYIYALKDLRNAIAHNSVVFDARFRSGRPSSPMRECLKLDVGLPYVNFKTIGDYIILMCYYLKLLKVSRTEIKAFIREFEKITDDYTHSVNPTVVSMVIHPDLASRMNILKNYL